MTYSPSRVLTNLWCAHAWDADDVSASEKDLVSFRLNVCYDEINPSPCKRLSETDGGVRVCVVYEGVLLSFCPPPC